MKSGSGKVMFSFAFGGDAWEEQKYDEEGGDEKPPVNIVLDSNNSTWLSRLLKQDSMRNDKSTWLLEETQGNTAAVDSGGAPFDSKIYLGNVEDEELMLSEAYKVRKPKLPTKYE